MNKHIRIAAAVMFCSLAGIVHANPPIVLTPSAKVVKVTLKTTVFTPGQVQLYPTVFLDKADKNCAIDVVVKTVIAGTDAINFPIVTNSLPPSEWNTTAKDVNIPAFNITGTGKFNVVVTARDVADKHCIGSASTEFEVTRQTLFLPTTPKPTITGIFQTGAVSHRGDSWRQDEPVDFYVEGNLKNNDNPALECGWSLFIVNSNGQGKLITTGSKFTMGKLLPAGTFSGYEPGEYSLRVKSSSADDTNAKTSCLGEASKKFMLVRAVAAIKDVQLKTFAFHFNAGTSDGHITPGANEPILSRDFCNNCNNIFSPAHDTGFLKITPVFTAGQMCSYTITQKFKGTKTTHIVMYTAGNVMGNVAPMAAPALNVYPDDDTTVEVTLAGTSGPGGACDGSVTKTITTHDSTAWPIQNK